MFDETFVSWCQSHGSVINGISCQPVDHGYRGIVATRDLAANEVVLLTPHRLLLSNTSHTNQFKDALLSFQQQHQKPLTSFQTLACLLIYESCQGPSSFWAPYLATIPPHYTTYEHLSSQDIAALQLPSAITKLHSYRQKAIHDWKQARPFLLHISNFINIQEKDQEKKEGWPTSWEAWAWASATLNSRTMHIAEDPTGGVLNPYGDMFNYSPPPPPITSNFPFITHQNSREEEDGTQEDDADTAIGGDGSMNVATGYYEIKTKKYYKKGDQVFLCYGRYTNIELLIHYGFVLPSNNNSHDTVMMPLEYFPPSVVEQLNHDGGDNDEAECYVHADGRPSWILAKAVRRGVLSGGERKRVGYRALGGEMVSEKGEAEAVRVMREACRKMLDTNNNGGRGLGMTTIEEDAEMLSRVGLKDTMRVVIEWRVEQKMIVKRCLERMETWSRLRGWE
jgi:hypothetical protein